MEFFFSAPTLQAMLQKVVETISREPDSNTETSTQQYEKDVAVPELESRETQDSGSEARPQDEPRFLDGWRLYTVTAGLMLSLICSGLVRSLSCSGRP